MLHTLLRHAYTRTHTHNLQRWISGKTYPFSEGAGIVHVWTKRTCKWIVHDEDKIQINKLQALVKKKQTKRVKRDSKAILQVTCVDPVLGVASHLARTPMHAHTRTYKFTQTHKLFHISTLMQVRVPFLHERDFLVARRRPVLSVRVCL